MWYIHYLQINDIISIQIHLESSNINIEDVESDRKYNKGQQNLEDYEQELEIKSVWIN